MRNAVVANFAGFGDYDAVTIAPDQNARVTACLRALAEGPHAQDMFAAQTQNAFGQQDEFWNTDGWESHYRPYVVKDGVLLVPVKGVLLHNFPYAVGSYATGYYYIQRAVERGLIDSNVKGIALVCDSPGGHVAGCFELVDRIYQARSKKPIAAFAHEHAYSAAYAVASAASKITVSRTGGVGSIGVVTMHVDFSKALEADGIKVTFIFAGKHKVDGNPYEPLSKDAQERIQARIDEAYGVFVGAVARNRKMEESAVRKTEALTFGSSEAVERGLADAIGPLDDALAAFCAGLEVEDGDEDMTTQTKPAEGVSQAEHEAAVAAAASTAAAAAKKRIADIKACDEAKDRPAAAESVAMNTDLDLAAAKAFLASLPKEAKAKTNEGDSGFDRAMDRAESGPGAGDEEEDEPQSDAAKADAAAERILGNVFGPRKSK